MVGRVCPCAVNIRGHNSSKAGRGAASKTTPHMARGLVLDFGWVSGNLGSSPHGFLSVGDSMELFGLPQSMVTGAQEGKMGA